jgi:predicted DsbA family dithiol-disulfide isomerase
MLVEVWSGYICPWCYLGRDRTALLRSLDVEVVQFPFELHPELPPAGRRVSANGRMAAVHAAIAQECADVGMAFKPPEHVPNSRHALEVAEVVRLRWPDAFLALDGALFEAHFVIGLDIGDADVVAALVERAGAPAADVTASLDAGDGKRAVDASIERARDHGIAATPAWKFENDFVLPGVQPRELFQRVVARLRARTGETPAGPGR